MNDLLKDDINLLNKQLDISNNTIYNIINKFNLDIVSIIIIFKKPEEYIIYENYDLINYHLNNLYKSNKDCIITNIHINIIRTKQFLLNINKNINTLPCFLSIIKIIFINFEDNFHNYIISYKNDNINNDNINNDNINNNNINNENIINNTNILKYINKEIYAKISYLKKLIKRYKNNNITTILNNNIIYQCEFELLNFLLDNSIINYKIYSNIFDKIIYIFYNENIDILSEESIILWYENIKLNKKYIFNNNNYKIILNKCEKFVEWLKN